MAADSSYIPISSSLEGFSFECYQSEYVGAPGRGTDRDGSGSERGHGGALSPSRRHLRDSHRRTKLKSSKNHLHHNTSAVSPVPRSSLLSGAERSNENIF